MSTLESKKTKMENPAWDENFASYKYGQKTNVNLHQEKKGHQHKAEQIDMADTTGMDHNRFGMSVNQSADVHAAGKKK